MKCQICGLTELRADNHSGVCRKTAACNTERQRRFRRKYAEGLAAVAAQEHATEVAMTIAWALDQAKEHD